MYFLDMGGFQVVGASPEMLVQAEGQRIKTRPLAGTRPRGVTPEEDSALADELMASDKERAEHVMLVDLGRNDIGRVAEGGTVHVSTLMAVEKYSHVMHIVSEVEGELECGKTGLDALRACFPAGTLSGAPKNPRDGDNCRDGAYTPRTLRGRGRLLQLFGGRGYRHNDQDDGGERRTRLRSGGGGNRGRLRSGDGIQRVLKQGAGRDESHQPGAGGRKWFS